MSRRLTLVLSALVVLVMFGLIYPATAQDFGSATDLDTSLCIYGTEETPVLFGGARPASLVVSEASLLSQPPLTTDTVPLEIVTIPVGAAVIVTDLDEQTRQYFRVIWPCGGRNFTGWIDTDAVRRNPARVNPRYAPPGCARAIGWVDLLDGFWTSTVTGNIAVVVDLYRNQGGTPYPQSFYYLTVNGREVRDKDRDFRTSGPFLVTGVVMGVNVRQGQPISFAVLPPPREPVNFFGIIYQVPEGCEFAE